MPSEDSFFESWADSQEWREVTRVEITERPFAAASAFLAMISDPDNTNRRDRLIACLIEYSKTMTGASPNIRRRDIDNSMARAARRINTRLRAANVATRVVAERSALESGMGIQAARSIREAFATETDPIILSFPASSHKRPSPAADKEYTHHFRDVWTPSRPALAMAMALSSECLGQTQRPSFADLVFRPDWIRKTLRRVPQIAYTLSEFDIVMPENLIILRRT